MAVVEEGVEDDVLSGGRRAGRRAGRRGVHAEEKCLLIWPMDTDQV